MAGVVSLKKVVKRYTRGKQKVEVLHGLDLEIEAGEFVALMGPSGSGKTTLLNMIAQIDTASGGEVRYQSEVAPLGDAKALNPGLSCRIGYVTQEDNLLPWRTTLENVLFPLNVQRRLNPETRARADMLIRTVGLAGFEHHYPHELSGGMRKRASLIRTLAYDPPVILMDEPFGALDAQTRLHLQEDLLRLWNLGRKTIVFVTHDIAEAIALGDRTLVLSRSPSRIAGEHIITIPRPRDIRGLMSHPEFGATYERIRAQVQ
jgi:NitT/TauT family transport system ATP-binding protein